LDEVKQVLGIKEEASTGSVGLKVGLLAVGERDLYVHPSSHSKAWDTCAAEALLHEAGGRLSDLLGNPLSYRGPDLRNRNGILASAAGIHELLAQRLRPIFGVGLPGNPELRIPDSA
ncbi:MAG: inositol monophosphatase family protein, partial [Pseudomonadota bacterium]